MEEILRILILDDSAIDVELIERELRSADVRYVLKHVMTESAFLSAIDQFEPALILSDYSVPGFSGEAALALVRGRCPDTPFIIVSGTLAGEKVVDLLKCGATDYVVKDAMRPRLGIAVRRALYEARERTARLQAQKMELFGALAGGVAHDFNNLLTVIGGYSQMMLSDTSADDRNYGYIEEILKAAEQATSLTNQLLAFTRKQATKPKVLNLNDVISDVAKMLRRLIGSDVQFRSELAPNLSAVKADAGQVQQVIINLAVNARDAMPNGGTLTIQTVNVNFQDGDLEEGLIGKIPPPGEYVRLSVTDTGVGMTEEVRSKIFEPFFTTKAPGHGTGLGLATCESIVAQGNGYIVLKTSLGHGSTFEVYLPRAEEAKEQLLGLSSPDSLLGGTETILVADDDDAVRQLTVAALVRLGYDVMEAEDGESAFALAQLNAGRKIHLMVTDVVMPKINGKNLALSIRSIHPETKILFMSGYPGNGLDEVGILRPQDAFHSKPLLPAKLAVQVRHMLDQ